MAKSKDKKKQVDEGKQPAKVSMHAIIKPKHQPTLPWAGNEPNPSPSTPFTADSEPMEDDVGVVLPIGTYSFFASYQLLDGSDETSKHASNVENDNDSTSIFQTPPPALVKCKSWVWGH